MGSRRQSELNAGRQPIGTAILVRQNEPVPFWRFSNKGASDMEIGILGPLFLRCGAASRAPTAPKLRNVLTTLVVNAGQVVSVSLLMRELWEDEPPVSGLTTLQTYILNLRKLFSAITSRPTAEISKEVLVTQPGGYLLRLDAGSLDVHRYHALVAAARAAIAAGDDAEAVHQLDEALRLWRGPALVDVQCGRVLESKRRQLEESRLVVLEHLVEGQLRLGMYHEVLTELVGLIVENPLHEGLHAQYMRTLHRLGRRAEALAVFRGLRDNLVEELGLEPSLAVRRAHQEILSSDGDGKHESTPHRLWAQAAQPALLPTARVY